MASIRFSNLSLIHKSIIRTTDPEKWNRNEKRVQQEARLSSSHWNKIPKAGWLINNRDLSGNLKARLETWNRGFSQVLVRTLFQAVGFSSYPPTAESRGSELSGGSYKGPAPFMTSSHPDFLPGTPPPNIITLGGRVSPYELRSRGEATQIFSPGHSNHSNLFLWVKKWTEESNGERSQRFFSELRNGSHRFKASEHNSASSSFPIYGSCDLRVPYVNLAAGSCSSAFCLYKVN